LWQLPSRRSLAGSTTVELFTGWWKPSFTDAGRARRDEAPKLEERGPPRSEPRPQARQFLPAQGQRSSQLRPLPSFTIAPFVTRAVRDPWIDHSLLHLASNWILNVHGVR
jgi:hypothetical protein